MASLLTYDQACEAIQQAICPLCLASRKGIKEAFGQVLAEAVYAPEANPRFDNSSVDGYAIGRSEDAQTGMKLRLAGAIAAGHRRDFGIEPGTAWRILTGAPIPQGTFGIAMQEDVRLDEEEVLLGVDVKEGDFIRRKGADFQAGAELLTPGVRADAGVASVLAFAGNLTPLVFDPPKVSLVTTGDELVDPSVVPTGGQIKDTNSVMLELQVAAVTGRYPTSRRVVDDREVLKDALVQAAAESHVLLVAGGASIGDRDFLVPVIEQIGEVLFHGVAVRPGKPFLFGRVGNTVVFGLPGNPASAYVCFEIFVRAALQKLAGQRDPRPLWTDLPSGVDHTAMGREDFVRVIYRDGSIFPVREQGSFGIFSLAEAQGLARFSAAENVSAGTAIPVTWLR